MKSQQIIMFLLFKPWEGWWLHFNFPSLWKIKRFFAKSTNLNKTIFTKRASFGSSPQPLAISPPPSWPKPPNTSAPYPISPNYNPQSTFNLLKFSTYHTNIRKIDYPKYLNLKDWVSKGRKYQTKMLYTVQIKDSIN